MPKNSDEFNNIVSEFFNRNQIQEDSQEKYIKGFSRKFGRFLSQEPFREHQDVKNMVMKCIKDEYRYYSQETISTYLKKFHVRLIEQIEGQGYLIDQCMFSNISNVDTSKHNSSNELVSKYMSLNDLENSYYIFFNTMVEKYTQLNNETDENLKRSKKIILENEIKDKQKKLKEIEYLILIDDYTGTGGTIIKFLEAIMESIPSNVEIIVYCIHGTQIAQKKIEEFIDNLGTEKPKVNLKFEETSEQYFLHNPKEEHIIQKFTELFLSDYEYSLGYKKTQSVLTTYRNTPNNTLSLFWKEWTKGCGWEPLFLRDVKTKNELKKIHQEKRAISWYFEREKIAKDIQNTLFVLLYIKQYPQSKIVKLNIELPKVLGYNKNILQDCLSDNFIAIKPNRENLLLTESGKIFLNKNIGLKTTLKSIKDEFENVGMKREKKVLRL